MLKKLLLLLWKSSIIRRRHWILSLFEIVTPTLLFIFMAYIRSLFGTEGTEFRYPTEIFNSVDQQTLQKEFTTKLGKYPLLYTPSASTFASAAMEKLKNKANIATKEFENEKALLNYYNNLNRSSSETVYAVIFEDLLPNVSVPQNLKYRIRIASANVPETSSLFPEDILPGLGSEDYYTETGLSGLQLHLDEVYLEMCNIEVPSIQVQKFPYPAYTSDLFNTVFAIMLSLFVVISYCLMCTAILKRIVEEKSSGIKELMKMMGLRTWILWLGWFINAMVINTLSVTIIVVCLKVPFGKNVAVLSRSNPLLVWLFLMLYCSAGVTFCFAVSAFFSRTTLAQNIGLLIWFVSYILAEVLVRQASVGLRFLAALLPNAAVSMGFQVLLSYEVLGQDLDWSNVFEGNLAIGYVCIMLFVDCIIYTLVACYVEAIRPGKYGVAKPIFFIFMPSFWRKRKMDNTELEDSDVGINMVFEPPPENSRTGIRIRNLRKVYYDSFRRNPKVAVDGVNLDIYSGKITALLGHNGAGKTTTMSILTGMIPPSSGSVYINDYDIATHMNKVRESLGLCPQHNLLFVDLTVMEHLIFFAVLKGQSLRKAKIEAKELLGQLNLLQKKNKLVSDLSGGMKRKLSLGIALIGNSIVLMLDEPTSGMDPEARRAVWDLLLSMRGQRTILITTHLMEEADVLGDRIAIMDHGLVHCYGTSLFLKKHYGTGYQLTLLKQDNCDVNEVTRTLQTVIPDVILKSETGAVINYSVPTESIGVFPQLFDTLESRKSSLGISSIGLSITSLDEVFVKVGKESEEQDGTGNEQTDTEYTKLNQYSSEAFEKLKGLRLYKQQMRSLLIKNILLTKRKWWILLLHAAVLLIFTIVALRDVIEEPHSEPALELKLEKYGKTIVLYSNVSKQYVQQYVQTVEKSGSELKEADNITASLLLVGENDLVSYKKKYVVAADFNNSITALYSTIAYHSLPISLNLIMNSILSTHTISVTVHPLNPTMLKTSMASASRLGTEIYFSILIPLGLLFVTGRFIMMPHDERVRRSKRLQYMSGVSPPMYWLSYFLWDFLIYLIIVVIMLITVLIFDRRSFFSGANEIATLMILLTVHGLSAIPCAYVFSFTLRRSAGAFTCYVLVNLIIGLVMPLIVSIFMQIPQYEHVGAGLSYTFDLFPHFAISYALMHFSRQATENNQCKSVSCKENNVGFCCKDSMQGLSSYKPYLVFASKSNPNGLMTEVLYLTFDGLVFLSVLVLLDYNVFAMAYEILVHLICGTNVRGQKELDEDVAQEQDRVNEQFKGTKSTLNGQEDIMLVHDLVKKYKGRFPAVKGISFGVMTGECFGLLGVNGAGKTTTFKMLTGDEIPTRGNATIFSYSLKKHKKEFLKQIGYCPQFDAINNALTGKEMLQLYANLRGIPRENLDQEVNKWVTLLGLQEYEKRKCGTYSGGNKRKLSTAIALIGDPPILFLDEPTSGVDPVARCKLWNILSMMQKAGQSIVLTSHSMDECEALCGRLAIMVAGQFICLGPIQYLKQKFCQGFTIKIKLKVMDDYDEQVEHVKYNFEQHPLFADNYILKDEYQGLLHYEITDTTITWSQLFKTMQELKGTNAMIEDYIVTETSLEQVFLHFAKQGKTK